MTFITQPGAAEAQSPATDYFAELIACLQAIDSESYHGPLSELLKALRSGALVAIAGNGGSASTAEHMAADLAMCARAAGLPGRVIPLSASTTAITQLANDCGYEHVFGQQVRCLLGRDDVLVVLSVSGSSRNLVVASTAALEVGASVIALLGVEGALARLSSSSFVVGCGDYGLVEDTHLAFGHLAARAVLGGPNTMDSRVGSACRFV